MDRHKTSSQVSIDKKLHTIKDNSSSSSTSINRQNQVQNEIDNLIQHGLLDPMLDYDRKLDFHCVSIVSRDQVIKQTRRQIYGLIWNSIRSPKISRLIRDDRSCAFVEILHPPAEWSRYDVDLLLLKIRQKTFLNGMNLRDEFVRILQIILKRDFNDEIAPEKKSNYEFKDMEFTRNTIQLVFNHRQDHELTLIVSLVLLVEFPVPGQEFFPEVAQALCSHEPFRDYFQTHPDAHYTRLTPWNSIKFLFDYQITEVHLCEFLLQQSHPLSSMFTNFLKLRRECFKYVQRAAKHAAETIKLQMHTDKYRQSTCSINSVRSGTSNTSSINSKHVLLFLTSTKLLHFACLELMQNKIPLSSEIEVAIDYLFSTPILRLLFLSMCSQYQRFGAENENSNAFAIERALQYFSNALENNYLEHPFVKSANILPDSLLAYEVSVKVGVKKLVKEMQRDWKRNIRR